MYTAGSCVMFVVCIDRMNATSSTTPARCGIASDTHAPHLPCFANLKGLRMIAPALAMNSISPASLSA